MPKMMPGQQPYTAGELIASAARAQELFGDDELERFAYEQRRPKENRKKMDRAKLVMKNGMHTVVTIPIGPDGPPQKFQHEGRVFELHHKVVTTTGNSNIRAVYSEVAK